MREHLELLYYFPLVLEIYSPVGNNLVIHLFFQSAFWGRGLLLSFSVVFALVEVPHPLFLPSASFQLVLCVPLVSWWLSASC